MNRKCKTAIIIALMCLLVASLVFAGCQDHRHKFAAEWKYDGNHHWKTCVHASCKKVNGYGEHEFDAEWYNNQTNHWHQCSVCGKKVDEEEHTVPEDGWVITKAPTQTQAGEKRGKCSVCNVVITQELPKIEHKHSFTGEYLSNDGWHWLQCSCGEMSEFVKHEVTNWTIDREATETTEGQKSGH